MWLVWKGEGGEDMTFYRKYSGDKPRAELRFCSQCGVEMLAAEVPVVEYMNGGAGGEGPARFEVSFCSVECQHTARRLPCYKLVAGEVLA